MAQKVTYQLDTEIVAAIRRAVEAGQAHTMSEFVEDAVRARIAELRREEIRTSVREAVRDPLFRADVEEISREFEAIDWEGGDDDR